VVDKYIRAESYSQLDFQEYLKNLSMEVFLVIVVAKLYWSPVFV
jgi:hypothetical protein